MKKLILIFFLITANVSAEENKWQYEDSFLTTKCFINEWPLKLTLNTTKI